jgi:hypothetical protein
MGKNKDTEVDKVAGIATDDDDVGKSGIQLGHMSAGWGVKPVPGYCEVDPSGVGVRSGAGVKHGCQCGTGRNKKQMELVGLELEGLLDAVGGSGNAG